MLRLGLSSGPGGGSLHPPRQQGNVEAVLTRVQVDLLFVRSQQERQQASGTAISGDTRNMRACPRFLPSGSSISGWV